MPDTSEYTVITNLAGDVLPSVQFWCSGAGGSNGLHGRVAHQHDPELVGWFVLDGETPDGRPYWAVWRGSLQAVEGGRELVRSRDLRRATGGYARVAVPCRVCGRDPQSKRDRLDALLSRIVQHSPADKPGLWVQSTDLIDAYNRL